MAKHLLVPKMNVGLVGNIPFEIGMEKTKSLLDFSIAFRWFQRIEIHEINVSGERRGTTAVKMIPDQVTHRPGADAPRLQSAVTCRSQREHESRRRARQGLEGLCKRSHDT